MQRYTAAELRRKTLRCERDRAVPQPRDTACRFQTMKLFLNQISAVSINFNRYCSSVLALFRYNLKVHPLANYKAGFASFPPAHCDPTYVYQKALIPRQRRGNSWRSEHISVIPSFHDEPE